MRIAYFIKKKLNALKLLNLKNQIRVLIIFIVITIVIFFIPKNILFITVILLLLIGVPAFFLSKDITSKIKRLKKGYSYFHKYTKAISYLSIVFLIVFLLSSFFYRVFDNKYTIVISDLPESFLKSGFNKEIIKYYFSENINKIHNSPPDNFSNNIIGSKPYSKSTIVSNIGKELKIELGGNNLYLDQTIQYFKELFGRNKTIRLHFGKSANDSIFYTGKIDLGEKFYFLNKRQIKINQKQIEFNQIKKLTHIAAYSSIKYIEPKKIIDYYKNNLLELEYLYTDFQNKLIKFSSEEEIYFYKVYGVALIINGRVNQGQLKLNHAINTFKLKELKNKQLYNDLIGHYLNSLILNGNYEIALEEIKKISSKLSSGKWYKAYIFSSTGKIKEAIEIYENFNDYNYVNQNIIEYYLINLYFQIGNEKKALLLLNKSFEGNNYDNFHLGQLISIYNRKNDFKNLTRITNKEFMEDTDFVLSNVLQEKNNQKTDLNLNVFSTIEKVNLRISNTFIQFYPYSRFTLIDFLLREENPSDLSFKIDLCNDYIDKFPNDDVFKLHYLSYLSSIKEIGLPSEKLYKISSDIMKKFQDRNIKIPEQVVYINLTSELKTNLIKYKIDNSSSLKNNDSIYSKKLFDSLKSKYYKNNFLALMHLMKNINDTSKVDYINTLNYVDSLNSTDFLTKKIMNKVKLSFLKLKIREELENKGKVDIERITNLIKHGLKLNHDDSELWISMGLVEDFKGNFVNAELDYYQSVSYNEKKIDSIFEIVADFHLDYENYKTAIPYYKKILLKQNLKDFDRYIAESLLESNDLAYIYEKIGYNDYLTNSSLISRYLDTDMYFKEAYRVAREEAILNGIEFVKTQSENSKKFFIKFLIHAEHYGYLPSNIIKDIMSRNLKLSYSKINEVLNSIKKYKELINKYSDKYSGISIKGGYIGKTLPN